ncbi:Sirohydrochlorin cobaltochelatase CbiKP [Candidatus Magnetomoraceae bacterium gMMP-1]
MKKQSLWLVIAICLSTFLAANVFASEHGHGDKREVKKGILLVAFGSSIPQAQVSFKNINMKVRTSFPGIPVRWAYTSSIIRHKLAKEGKQLDSVAVALAKMMDENFTNVAVQSLHTIEGEEYNDLLNTVNAFQEMPEGFDKIIVGRPLLSTQDDIEEVVDAIMENIPKERKKDEAVVLMGHGTPHPANAFYAALMFNLQRKDSNIFVGTVEGSPEIDDIKAMIQEKNIKKAYLMPFMSVAGDHARNDMLGSEDDSWKSILEKSGVKCQAVLKGTAEFNNMVDIWVDHLKVVMAHF